MTRYLTYSSFFFLSFAMNISCAVNLESTTILDNLRPDHFSNLQKMLKYHRESLIISSFPSISDIAGMQEATEVRSRHLQRTTRARSGAVATAETFEAESLSGYLFDIVFYGIDCSDNFFRGGSKKLNTCLESNNGSEMITATANMITTSSYSDISCREKIAVNSVPYTSGCEPGRIGKTLARVMVIKPTSAYPFPLSHLQLR